jgi:23S rRNA pseudouridine1911/1915/1917 synthase
MRHRFVAPAEDRLDKLIAAHTPLSRARARKAIEGGGVRVGGQLPRFASDLVPEGAVVEVRSGGVARDALPGLVERYRDADILVVEKPVGLPSQGTRMGDRTHLMSILQAREPYVGLHHRLDTPASGLLVVALDRAANPGLAKAFREGWVDRGYLAVVVGDPGPRGHWAEPIDGEPARTRWRRLVAADGYSILYAALETGRTHQVRIHCAMAGHPILGDRRHGGAAGRAWPRLALHAWTLSLPHPRTGVRLQVRSPVPADLVGLVPEDLEPGELP